MIPFLSLKAATEELSTEIEAAVLRSVRSGQYIGGEECAVFERGFSDFTGAAHTVGTGNGLDALHLALRAMGVGPGDEVIVAANTFIATLLAVTMVGATPILVEPDERTYNLDPAMVVAAITKKTKVILPTHLYGQPADLDALQKIADEYGLQLLEDAAQAHGAEYKGIRVGARGSAACWSFYPGKNLGALGDGGAVTANAPELANAVRLLGNYGSSVRYAHEMQGFNSRLDPIQASVLSVKLAHLEEWNKRRAAIAGAYLKGLKGTGLTLPVVPEWAKPSWHLFVVLCDDRDGLQKRLLAEGVQTLIHYPTPPHLQGAYQDLGFKRGSLPITERLARHCLSLPIGPHLGPEQAAEVIEAIRRCV
ncbi:DegT/DnrJ/EryC1/StrS family aminotransferase [Sphingomonas swuensis]|uniref:DegT/DnrJ/EryC1/StrS family aminotransferase n=1 Tax=Sphingomonas swuensis TaxID=977800 RepID=A0ABP7SQV6_9SPHN